MSKTIEKEERIMLTKNQYEKLIEDFSSYKEKRNISITNIYFDNKNHYLLNRHIVFRLRFFEEEDNIELTLKIKGNNGDIEITQLLNKKEKESALDLFFPDGEVKDYLLGLKIDLSDISIITSLKTKRMEIKESDYLIVIDKNNYNNITDYDLEIESSSIRKSKSIILSMAKKYNLTYEKTYLSKSRRAFESIKN